MAFLKLEWKVLRTILPIAVEKLPCCTWAGFNNLIHLGASLIRQRVPLGLLLAIRVFILCHLPPLCLAGSVLIQASADGIPGHYHAEGGWDLGAQWGVTPRSGGRQLLVNDNAPVMTHGAWEPALLRKSPSWEVERWCPGNKDGWFPCGLCRISPVPCHHYWHQQDKNDGLSLVGRSRCSHKHCWRCAARKSVEIFNYLNGELKSACVSSAMKSAEKGCKMLKQWQAPGWRMQHVVVMRRVSKRSVFFQRQASNRRKKVMSPSPSQYCHLYAISSLNSH